MSYIDSNIPKSIFCEKDFNEKAMELVNRMKAQEANSLRCRKALFKDIPRHEKAFASFGKT